MYECSLSFRSSEIRLCVFVYCVCSVERELFRRMSRLAASDPPHRPAVIVRRSNLNHREIFPCPAGSRLRLCEGQPSGRHAGIKSADPRTAQPPMRRGPFGSTGSRNGIPFFQAVAAINVRAWPWPIVRRAPEKNGRPYRGTNFLIFV